MHLPVPFYTTTTTITSTIEGTSSTMVCFLKINNSRFCKTKKIGLTDKGRLGYDENEKKECSPLPFLSIFLSFC
jgi:hypothetical protein